MESPGWNTNNIQPLRQLLRFRQVPEKRQLHSHIFWSQPSLEAEHTIST